MSSQELIEQLKNAVIDYEVDSATEIAREILEKGIDPLEAIDKGLAVGIKIVGEKFGAGEIFLPELIMGAESMKAAMAILEPALPAGAGRTSKGKVLIGTVLDDIHEIGKNLVATLLSSNGFEVVDLGTNITKEQFEQKLDELKPDILALSALMTTTMPHMAEVVKDITASGKNIKTIVGGAPVTDDYAKKIGATGYSEDAAGAVTVVSKFLGSK